MRNSETHKERERETTRASASPDKESHDARQRQRDKEVAVMAADMAAFMEVTVVPRFLAYVSVDWMERYTAANTDSALCARLSLLGHAPVWTCVTVTPRPCKASRPVGCV